MRNRGGALAGALAAGALAAACSACSAGRAPSAAGSSSPTTPAPTTTSSTTPTTVAPTTTTTSTTVDPGTLPQTTQLPSGSDPAFLARIQALWQAVLTGQPALAGPAFFPLSAYIQVKGISDPVHDYQTRLIPDYDQDIASLHRQIGSTGTLASVTVPPAAEWIRPGVEYNKGSYWRVYGTRVNFTVGGAAHYFTIASMISWRGEWYVVHLSSIR
ncbi:MAG TPA: hypothetical protein VFN68_09255 [Acidimicrobiales bacterium]|nr:hypothetical protein [Acidimicrobiales bacterium]